MRIITDICGATTGSARDIDNWINRLNLRTAYEPTKRGRFRRYTWENTLELTIMVAFVRAGIRPAMASLLAGLRATDPRFEPQDFLIRTDRNDQALFGGDSISLAELPEHLRASDVIILIQEKQVVDRARAFFEEKAQEVSDYVHAPPRKYEEGDLAFLLKHGGEHD